MRKDTGMLSELAVFVAGVLAAGLMSNRRRSSAVPAGDSGELQDAIASLESRVSQQEAITAARLGRLEARLEDHSAKLAEVPSTEQIVAAMEQLLSKTMASLDQRLTTQAHSIEVLKTTVSQTDSLLERVLESLDSLQTFNEPMESGDEQFLQRAG
jgi:chromosome segregation ATPase